ncbi:MAG: hypothetical protein JO092_11895 [Candidatus Eremiobacteraeota bacterium]|nr:hypothetical protein [Candidatus Eremiobacteraeota bacterium]
MKTVTRFALSIGAVALFAACGGSQLPISAPGATPQTSTVVPARAGAGLTRLAWSHQVLYAFDLQPQNEGSGEPLGGLLDVNGTLYGTTYYGTGGPRGRKCPEARSCGTVYSLTTTGEYKTLHAFHGGARDGALPRAGLIDVNGTLYGTTESGGSGCGCGTVYSISTSGAEKALYSFAGGSDGANPTQGDLLYMKGTLYGTTSKGGSSGCSSGEGCGTVYSVTTSGKEKVLHSFGSGDDGADPEWGLINVKGKMYGTTVGGGAHLCGSVVSRGCGTVYRISTSGVEKVLYSFAGGSDGATPYGGLIDVEGMLYGTTALGGAGACGGTQSSCGTVYSITTTGQEKVLHSFQGGSHGLNPVGSLIGVNGKLYGVTAGTIAIAPLRGASGKALDRCGMSCGTVFSVTTTGEEKALYRFAGGADGYQPDAALINVNGTLYGTTYYGGKGWGTIFALFP